MVWRLADSLEVLRDELNERWPDRDKSSDGTIGDPNHAAEGAASDHNAWLIGSNGIGVVRAYDIDVDLNGDNVNNYGGSDIRALAEHLRELGEGGDERMIGGGYVIFAGQIASDVGGWVWRPYTGADPHTSHIHLSVTRSGATPASPYPTTDPALFDHTQPWGVGAPAGDDDMPLNADDQKAIADQCDAAIIRACRPGGAIASLVDGLAVQVSKIQAGGGLASGDHPISGTIHID